ncbi:RNA polymerase sigma factor [Terrisporobacter mayombei]|uniref:ECF RNA polymerase sigma factor SigW n=1 Tax=Terrisporobacter mayombei TaxID=1541 RepID=A0ABY9PXH2_9FIRM|nr:sigma-70 family RNA polymerase sigma factor [Terrisporobacter mayombei]MCC3868222.1 sigma-70 family RNA polymerase sigma factor [Terrisporobacter mayombei]WMT80362.1 ECF RNA polymerase sigma factor SigW [Terrisporobacter mayombei]
MENLIKKAKKGDEEAFFNLIEINKISLYKAGRAILNNDEDVADAIQETVISAYRNIKSLKNDSYFKTWLTKILINKCKDIMSKNKETVILDDYVEEGYIQEFLSEFEIEDLLNDLSKEQKLVVSLYYISQFNTREISEILKEPEGTIKSRISRAKTKLRESFAMR